jgi:hypothetical protein
MLDSNYMKDKTRTILPLCTHDHTSLSVFSTAEKKLISSLVQEGYLAINFLLKALSCCLLLADTDLCYRLVLCNIDRILLSSFI